MKYTDHTRPQINLLQYLPEVYKSDINTILDNMVFDRYFTKDDTTRISGYIGKPNKNAIVDKQLIEESPHRQAFQLAPTMYTRVGTIDSALSFKRFEQQLNLMGVDINRLPKWGNSISFNWVPPINIDMLINYQDYFWINSTTNQYPQYFTIENRCNKSSIKILAYENIIHNRGDKFNMSSFDITSNSFYVDGNQTSKFPIGSEFYTTASTSLSFNNQTWTVNSVTYDTVLERTQLVPTSKIVYTNSTAPSNPINNQWWVDSTTNKLKYWNGNSWVVFTDFANITTQISTQAKFNIIGADFTTNSFLINGNESDIFMNGFVFFTKNSNVLLSTFWTALSSTYNSVTDVTTITVQENIAIYSNTIPTTSIVGQLWYNTTTHVLSRWTGTVWQHISSNIIADISLIETLAAYRRTSTSICNNETGWDIGLWDDNNVGSILWNTSLMEQISYPTLVGWLSNPSNVQTHLALWYDTTNDFLYQYGDKNHPNPSDIGYAPSWTAIIGNFSTILNNTTGNIVWDENKNKVVIQTDKWSTENNWLHKSGVQSFAGIRRAQVPILEYNSTTELNEWAQATIPWKYRSESEGTFQTSSIEPNRLELEPIKNYVAVPIQGHWYIYLFNTSTDIVTNINLTNTFVKDYRFAITDNNSNYFVYTVDFSEYRLMTTNDPVEVQGSYMVTVVKIQELVFSSPQIGDGIHESRIIPTITSHNEIWRGYHIHWCADLTNITYEPTTNQKLNVLAEVDNNTQPTHLVIQGNPTYSTFEPQIGILSLGSTYQEFTVDILTPVTIVTLHSSFVYDIHHSNTYVVDRNDLRVYINNIRQYGNYTEQFTTHYPTYTAINDPNSNPINSTIVPITSIVGIVFDQGVVKQGDVVRIEVGPISFYDMGLNSVPIRTIENDTQFYTAVNSGQQPIYSSITKYHKNEQSKVNINQYPLFNIYDILTNNVIKVSPIFAYEENPSAPIDPNTGRRIVITNNGTEFAFIQYLVETDNGIMYAYRNTNKLSADTFWYNPNTNEVLYWNRTSWSQYVNVTTNNTTLAIRKIQVSSTDPVYLWDMDQAIWYNPDTNILYKRQVSTNSWVVYNNAVITNKTDPSLQTIWRHGNHNEEYVPAYVDKDRNPIQVGSSLGDWEVVSQWMNNPEHLNKQTISFSQIFTHLNSILNNQQGIAGLTSKGVYAYTQDEYQYNVGGTIKEFNYGFDTLISAVNVNNVTPVGVIEFAEEQYTSNLYNIRGIFNQLVYSTFTLTSLESIINFTNIIINEVITSFELNDMYAKIYGDTTAFDSNTNTGIKNWIATSPMFGLTPVVQPNLSFDGTTSFLIHHDNHRTNVTYNYAEIDNFARKLVSQIDSRSNLAIGRIGTTVPPVTTSALLNIFTGYAPGVIPSGVYWYDSVHSKLYRFELYQASATTPSIYYGATELPNGTKYYNTTDHAVYEKDTNGWVLITTVGAGDISPIWTEINLSHLLGEVYLEIENRLYDIAKNTKMVFDYSSLILDDVDQIDYNIQYQERFNNYVSQSGIVSPLINSQYSSTDPWTWNYSNCSVVLKPINKTVSSYACWQAVYNAWYNTPYPHLEPWKLQGYNNKPSWWDSVYAQTNGSRRWLPLMWTNVLNGIVPLGYLYPSGVLSTGNPIADNQVLPTYNYVSVNIGNVAIGTYGIDDLLPPYFLTNDPTIRSIFNEYNQIIAPDADYSFYSRGPVEWSWMVSIQYQYDQLVLGFLMQPVKFLHYAFGPTYTIVDMLQIHDVSSNVYSHKNTLFHGDVYDTNLVYKVNGLNQWYVNYNRYTGYDVNAEFRDMWTKWTPLLTYQVGGISDTSSLSINNIHFDIISSDYNPILVNNGIVKDLWLDLFKITIINTPPSIIQYNNQSLWTFDVSTMAKVPRTTTYYGVKSYPFVVDTTTNMCQAYKYTIIDVAIDTKRLYVEGDQTHVFVANKNISITDIHNITTTNTVIISVYEPSVNRTRINMVNTVSINMINGIITPTTFVLPWSTGDMVVLSSSKLLPYPLVANTPYYVVRNNTMTSDQFMLAETYNESLTNTTIDFTTPGTGELLVSEIVSSFNALGGQSKSQETWYHYALDKNVVNTISFPTTIKGMQNLLNVIDGIAEVYIEQGFVVDSADTSDFDPVFGRLINWQLEMERFIDWAYGIRALKINVGDRYAISINATTNIIQFTNMIPSWSNGAKVMLSATGSVPTPTYAYTPYYLFQTNVIGEYVLSISANAFDTSMYVDFQNVGTGTVYLLAYDRQSGFPTFEMNPVRNNIWLSTPQGVVDNVLEGPQTDVRVQNTLFDQYGRPLTNDKINVYRQDLRTQISIVSNIQNDVDKFYTNDPYNYLHIGGGHIFINGYEHFILFNDYTVGNNLVYDPFLGLVINRLNIDYYEKLGYVLRPTLGGYYLVGNEFHRNIDGQATDMNNMYDILITLDNSEISSRSRELLGYKKNMSYMDLLNVNSKSQFLFYRGMIATKGSMNSFSAYINSKRFLDAAIDEYWAYEIAEFGDNRSKVYPEVKIFANDNIIDDIRLEFIGKGESNKSLSIVEAEQQGFKIISYYDQTRWNNYPEQMSLLDDVLFLDAEITSHTIVFVNSFSPPPSLFNKYPYWYNTNNNQLYSWNIDTNAWSTPVIGKVKKINGNVYWAHDTICDDVRIIRDDIPIIVTTHNIISITNSTITISGNHIDTIYSGMTFSIINSSVPTEPVYTIAHSTFDDTLVQTIITIDTTITGIFAPGITGVIVIDIADFSSYSSVVLTNNTSGLSSYYQLNSEVVRFESSAFTKLLHFYTINPSKHKINFAELVDVKSNVIVQDIPLWHPALGYHYYVADHNINLKNDRDPAQYGHTVNTLDVSNRAWNDNEVGTVWLNTAYLGYVPYYDSQIYSDVNDRLANWGKLAAFGQAKVYVWVRSSVLPSEWNAMVLSQANDITIPQNSKITGNTKLEMFTNTRVAHPGTLNLTTNTITLTDPILDSDLFVFSINGTIPQDVTVSTQYSIYSSTGVYTDQPVNGAFHIADTKNNLITFTQLSEVVTVVEVPINTSTDGYYTNVNKYMVQSPINFVSNGDVLKFTTTGLLPEGIHADTSTDTYEYVVSNAYLDVSGTHLLFDLQEIHTNTITGTFPPTNVVLAPAHSITGSTEYYHEVGKGTLTATISKRSVILTPAFTNDTWSKRPFIRKHTAASMLITFPIVTSVLTWKNRRGIDPDWINGEIADIYVNGTLTYSSSPITVTPESSTIDVITVSINSLYHTNTSININEQDIIDIVRSYANVDLTFDPTQSDDGTNMIWWKQDYEYTTVTTKDAIGNIITSYYFWVENSTNVPTGNDPMSIAGISTSLVDNPAPYFIVQKPLDITGTSPSSYGYNVQPYGTIYSGGDSTTISYDQFPITYREAIIRKVASYVSTNDRYMVRFVRDLTLRDDIQANRLNNNLKNVHQEWELFRRTQQYNIPLYLWNKLIEALSGISLTQDGNGNYPVVPSLDRVLYDQLYLTETRFGLSTNQAFVDRTLGLATLMNYLTDPSIDFQPIDIEDFFKHYSFDTPSNIQAALTEIYNTFGYTHVNNIWFNILQDALTTKSKYKGLMKTSWVSIHGVQLANVNGIFDE